jgi:hypothetical protein
MLDIPLRQALVSIGLKIEKIPDFVKKFSWGWMVVKN